MEKEIEEIISSNDKIDKRTNDEKIKDTIYKISPLVKRLWQYKWRILLFNFSIAIIFILFLVFIFKSNYESNIVILPEYGSKTPALGNLSGLASLAGVNFGEGTPIEIYENLLSSESVLESVIYRKYNTNEFPMPVNLIQYFEIEADEDEEPETAKRIAFLTAYTDLVKSRIKTNVEKISSILTVTIKMPESKLAADVSNNLVESLDQYVRVKRKSFATEQRKYIEVRLEQVKDSLRIVENQLNDFQGKNRIILQSPSLIMAQSRLLRNVEIQQTIFIELTKQLEIAKIDEIKDSPIINFREEAKDSILPVGPRKAVLFVIIVFLSFCISCLYYMFAPRLKYYIKLFKKYSF